MSAPTLEGISLEVIGRRGDGFAHADLLVSLAHRQIECLRWLSTIRIGTGGTPMHVAQKCASMASRGEDWKAHRDRAVSERLTEPMRRGRR